MNESFFHCHLKRERERKKEKKKVKYSESHLCHNEKLVETDETFSKASRNL